MESTELNLTSTKMATFVPAFVLGAATGSIATYSAMISASVSEFAAKTKETVTTFSGYIGAKLIYAGVWLSPTPRVTQEHLD